MLNLAKLFNKSPFAPLKSHMLQVDLCIEKLKNLFKALRDKDAQSASSIAKEISKLEHQADLIKNDIRNHLPRSMFLPINRQDLLEILSLQDSLADIAEDIAIAANIQPLHMYGQLQNDFDLFLEKNIEVFLLVKKIIDEFDLLLEASFGGIEAKNINKLIEEIAYKEHQIDLHQNEIVKKLYKLSNDMHYSSFNLYQEIIKKIAGLSNIGEKLSNRIRMILELS